MLCNTFDLHYEITKQERWKIKKRKKQQQQKNKQKTNKQKQQQQVETKKTPSECQSKRLVLSVKVACIFYTFLMQHFETV